jgi:hypothetical protein
MFTMTRIDFQPSANEELNRRHEVLIPFTRSNGLPPHPVPLAQSDHTATIYNLATGAVKVFFCCSLDHGWWWQGAKARHRRFLFKPGVPLLSQWQIHSAIPMLSTEPPSPEWFHS